MSGGVNGPAGLILGQNVLHSNFTSKRKSIITMEGGALPRYLSN